MNYFTSVFSGHTAHERVLFISYPASYKATHKNKFLKKCVSYTIETLRKHLSFQHRIVVKYITASKFSCPVQIYITHAVNFSELVIRPFEKRTYYAVAMSVRQSVRPSIRPSVRPRFRTFLQHALRYQFQTWYIHSVGGTTCRVWVASQLGHFDPVYSQK